MREHMVHRNSTVIQLPVHNSPYSKNINHVPSCIDDIISTICCYYNKNFYPMFAGSYCFLLGYSSGSHYYEKIQIEDNSSQLLFGCSGIRYEFGENKDIKSIILIILEALRNNEFVAIHIDSFYCPWDKLFGQLHNNHVVLVTGINVKKSLLFVCDPWFDKEEWIDWNIIKTACKFYIKFYIEDCSMCDINDTFLVENLNLSINRKHQNAFENIRLFANMLLENFDYTDLDSVNYFDSTFQKKLQQVVYSRCKYLSFMNFIIPKSKIITHNHCTEFSRFISSWQITQRMIAKAYIQKSKANNDFIKHIYNKIILISKEEELFLTNRILNEFPKNIHFIEKNISSKSKASSFENVDLSEYLNNKAFDDVLGNYSANFSGKRTFFLINNEITIQKQHICGEKIDLYENVNKKFDNVTCLGQEIHVGVQCVLGITVYGCSEFGSFSDYWRLVDKNNNNYYFEVSISDHSVSPKYNENIVYTGDVYIRESNQKCKFVRSNCHIFSKEILFGRLIEIEKIVLPNCPCTHVFFVVLHKK